MVFSVVSVPFFWRSYSFCQALEAGADRAGAAAATAGRFARDREVAALPAAAASPVASVALPAASRPTNRRRVIGVRAVRLMNAPRGSRSDLRKPRAPGA